MTKDNKMKFIRKNGKIIPIGPKKEGQGKSRHKATNAEKGSLHTGLSQYHSGKSREHKKKNFKRSMAFGALGALAGAAIGSRFKLGMISSVAGFAAGSLAGTNTGKHGKLARYHSKKSSDHTKKFNKYWDKTKNKDSFGEGNARRAHQRGLSGSSV